jgi:hypothetical protein
VDSRKARGYDGLTWLFESQGEIMLIPSLKNYRFPPTASVYEYSSLTDLGIIHSVSYPANGNDNYYRRNIISMVGHGTRIYVGGGHARNDNPGGDTGATVTPRYIQTTDDSFVSLTYANTSQTAKEFQHPFFIGDDVFFSDIDSKETADTNIFRLESDQLVRYRIMGARNHNYYIHQSRRNPIKWFSTHGWTTGGSGTHSATTVFDGLAALPTVTQGPANWFGSRGYVIMEFGPTESARLFTNQNFISNYAWETYPTTEELESDSSTAHEFNFSTNTWSKISRYSFCSGLDANYINSQVAPAEDDTLLALGNKYWHAPMKLRRLDDDTYITVLGRGRLGGKFEFPGFFIDLDTANGKLQHDLYGGVYRITLTDQKPFPAAWGNTFFHCERVLDNPQVTGRQWDYQVVGSDTYVLTETKDFNWHVYKNGVEIIRVTNPPTYARCFCILGSDIYFGLSSDDGDGWRNNGTTINANAGRILKLSNAIPS